MTTNVNSASIIQFLWAFEDEKHIFGILLEVV